MPLRLNPRWKLYFLKATTYRIICFFATVSVAYMITGSFIEAGWISVITQSILFFIYPVHEHLWRNRCAN